MVKGQTFLVMGTILRENIKVENQRVMGCIPGPMDASMKDTLKEV